jgi:hypothetical protein
MDWSVAVLDTSRWARMTNAPAWARARAMAAPIPSALIRVSVSVECSLEEYSDQENSPLLAPVTSAVWPLSENKSRTGIDGVGASRSGRAVVILV